MAHHSPVFPFHGSLVQGHCIHLINYLWPGMFLDKKDREQTHGVKPKSSIANKGEKWEREEMSYELW